MSKSEWRIPAERMKMRTAHIVPLSRQAVAVLEKCRNCDIVHICGGGYFAHRYSPENGFRTPSIYCADLEKLIRHIQKTVQGTLEAERKS